jgi:hypothetical protein
MINISKNSSPKARSTKHEGQHRYTETISRNVVQKSKSVGYDTVPGIWKLRRGTERPHHINTLPLTHESNGIDTRTVKSDTCLSPPKYRNVDYMKQSDHGGTSKKSPATVLKFDKQSSLHQSASTKQSLSNHGNSVLEILSAYSSHRANFNLSSCFSDDEESDGSSFADDDKVLPPITVRLSTSNVSLPSELTSSTSLERLAMFSSPSSKSNERRTLQHEISRRTTDFMPRPPRRKSSDRDSSAESRSNHLVPKHIQCFPMDESPTVPSRQKSSKNLIDSSSSILTKLSSVDLSPKKPSRQSSEKSIDFETSFVVQSGQSVDSLPQKPVRQESFTNTGQQVLSNTSTSGRFPVPKAKGSSTPPIRRIVRSESMLQPHLPALSRRTSIITEKTRQELPLVVQSME